MNVNDIIQYGGLVVSIGLILLAWKSKSHETKNLDSDSIKKKAEAQQIMSTLNDKYVQQIAEMQTKMEAQEARLQVVENPKDYEIVVRFKTSTPPEIGEVKISPFTPMTSVNPIPARKKLHPFQ